jgi:hypothetical protein
MHIKCTPGHLEKKEDELFGGKKIEL